jgi:PKD repeat protein
MTVRTVSLTLLFALACTVAAAQTFSRVLDSSNPIVTATGGGTVGYSGAAWVDYDNDGDIDLFACPDVLYKNNGGGQFTEVTNHGIGIGLPHAPATGVTWADMDNDGDIDCLYSGPASVLYRNNGKDSGFTFTRITRGDISSVNNRGWAGAWGDMDNDGLVDPIITHPRGFVGTAVKNPFFRNLGAGEFMKITTGDVVAELAPYTVATWYDYDMDGDQDLFIGSGPAGVAARDYIFKNMLKETGTADLVRINNGIIGTDLVDGQVWNWIDYDNDGDLDAYLTNYSGVTNNNLYRNDQGIYTKMTVESAGMIVSSNNNSLSNIWVDFDNDGDLDCYITRDGPRLSAYYANNGNGIFAKIDSVPMAKIIGPHIAAVAGDYDNDGDMDLFVISGSGANELYRNGQPAANNWLMVTVNGYPHNRSAIGAKVKVKATVNGKSYWQFREISAQNSFNGHNSLTAHFGLGDASLIDSLVIEWLSGTRKVMTNVPAKQHLTITEEGSPKYLRSVFTADNTMEQVPMTVHFTDLSYGDSTSAPVSWKWDFDNDGTIDASVRSPQFTYSVPDTYTVKLIVSDGVKSDTLIRRDYIAALPALPSISVNTTQVNFGPIDVNTVKKDTTIYVYNYGKGKDSLTVELVYGITTSGTVKPDSALSISPKSFTLGLKDSVGVTFTIHPRRVNRTNLTITYTPKIVITSRFNSGAKVFEKNMFFKLSGSLLEAPGVPAIPNVYALEQNFPNPFNPETNIRFSIPTGVASSGNDGNSRVVLEVFSVLGERVAVLVDEEKAPGSHSVQWNATGFASGLYYYRLKTNEFTETKKLLLVK